MNILIVFGSLLGKTQRVAQLIGTEVSKAHYKVVVKDVRDVSISDLNKYDLIILGSSTWDDGELQFDFRPFHKELISSNFPDKKFAVFALGSYKYPHPLMAADILVGTVYKLGGNLILDPLKLDIDHDDPEDKRDKEVYDWVGKLVAELNRLSF
jgi:flavodoxin I